MSSVISIEYLLNYIPRWPMFVNLITACICLGMSAIYHNFNYLDKKYADKLITLDYGGICILIMGSTFPVIFYPYACDRLHGMRNFFLIISSVSNIGFFFILLNDRMASSECRAFRAFGFCVLGISAIAPLAYLLFSIDKADQSFFSIYPYAVGGAIYIGGAFIYSARTPERFKTRTFDIIGSSH
jgi:adiponectin receptor